MKKFLIPFLTFLGFTFSSELIPCKVVRVVDGDTFRCVPEGKSRFIKVRLMGIDTLETNNMKKGMGQAKWFYGGIRTVKEFGKKAKEFSKRLIDKKVVYLELPVRKMDNNGRYLAYVWLDEYRNKMLNLLLVKEGLAFVFIIPPQVKYLKELGEAQEEAYKDRRGFWKYFKGE
ncbi:thermonuclease family protein [Aquifex aeolicus]|uniref:Thermococcal nuclease homolog n=1 Tax=Aquifex aeolicus (strain VF5) TaxID=224324 RepID=O66926_AQUAE|nr:thermonuclease family protein [Aquifex aeolicus]AAC06884.1 thermococcal nuclease homolog [Aquifex aeolicus VF5]